MSCLIAYTKTFDIIQVTRILTVDVDINVFFKVAVDFSGGSSYLIDMPSVYDYYDYRAFLRDCYEERKKQDTYFSYRFMGNKAGLDAGYLVRVLQGLDHLPDRCIAKLSALFKLDREETAFLRALIAYNKARTQSRIRETFARLLQLRSVSRRSLESHQYEYYNKWYYSAVRALIGLYDFDGSDYGQLARRLDPEISIDESREAVELLEKIGLIRRHEDGMYRVTDTMITTGEQWRSHAVRAYQKETFNLAVRSLEKQPPDKRDLSTVTFTVAEKDLDELRERIAEFRTSLLSMARQSDTPDTVYQLNVQLFPLNKPQRQAR